MSERADRLLKRIWLVNGVAALVLLSVLAGWALFMAASLLWHGRDGIAAGGPEAADSAAVQPRAVRLGYPAEIRGSRTRFIMVEHGRGNYPAGAALSGSYSGSARADSYYGDGPVVNVIFLRPGGGSGLLFQKPALVVSTDYPRPEAKEDAGQGWIAFVTVLEDTNHNGRLDRDDRQDLYLTDLDGSGRHRVLTDSFSVQSFTRLKDPERLLVYALDVSGNLKDDDRPLRAFIVDPVTGTAESDAAINDLAEEAGRIVGK